MAKLMKAQNALNLLLELEDQDLGVDDDTSNSSCVSTVSSKAAPVKLNQDGQSNMAKSHSLKRLNSVREQSSDEENNRGQHNPVKSSKVKRLKFDSENIPPPSMAKQQVNKPKIAVKEESDDDEDDDVPLSALIKNKIAAASPLPLKKTPASPSTRRVLGELKPERNIIVNKKKCVESDEDDDEDDVPLSKLLLNRKALAEVKSNKVVNNPEIRKVMVKLDRMSSFEIKSRINKPGGSALDENKSKFLRLLDDRPAIESVLMGVYDFVHEDLAQYQKLVANKTDFVYHDPGEEDKFSHQSSLLRSPRIEPIRLI